MEHQSHTSGYKAGMSEKQQPVQRMQENPIDNSAARETSTPYIPLSQLTGQTKVNAPSNSNTTAAPTASAGTTGQNEIREPIDPQLVGLGGWLIWFQIRLYIGGLRLLGEFNNDVGFLLFISCGLIITCLVLFYKRNISFRAVYIALIGFNTLSFLMYLPEGIPLIIVTLIVEGSIIIALFKSERVKNTFR